MLIYNSIVFVFIFLNLFSAKRKSKKIGVYVLIC